MAKALWKGTLIADADNDRIKLVEGNVYFPIETVGDKYLRRSDTHTYCGWKGTANYYDVVVDAEINKDAAWYYPEPYDAAKEIAGYVAFWRGVEVTDAPAGPGKLPPRSDDDACLVP